MQQWLILPTSEKILGIVILSIFTSFILIALGLFIKWIKPIINKKGFVLQFEDKEDVKEDNEEDEDNKKKSLSSCIEETPSFGNELLYVVSKSIRFGYDLSILKEMTTIRNQMNSASIQISIILNIFLRGYQEKIDDFLDRGIYVPEASLRVFQEFMNRLIKINFSEELKKAFKENGLLSYTEEAYEEVYCRDRIKKILSDFRSNLQTFFPSTLIPTSTEIISILDKNENSIILSLKEAIKEARVIAKQTYEEEERRKSIFDAELLSVAGIERASRSGK
jgi:hypothetical protein